MSEVVHAGLIAVHGGAAGWRGALLLGRSGAGKSDFALRALGEGWRLVADDRVIVWAAADRAFGRAPAPLSGLIELRGQGMASAPPLPFAEIVLAAHLCPPSDRQPEPALALVAGIGLPAVEIAPFEASGPQRLRQMLGAFAARL